MSTPREPWKYENPLCAEVGTDLFYIDDRDEIKSVPRISDYENAKKICKKCPHLAECREWAIQKEAHGFWGGLNPRERKTIRGKLKIVISEDIAEAV